MFKKTDDKQQNKSTGLLNAGTLFKRNGYEVLQGKDSAKPAKPHNNDVKSYGTMPNTDTTVKEIPADDTNSCVIA